MSSGFARIAWKPRFLKESTHSREKDETQRFLISTFLGASWHHQPHCELEGGSIMPTYEYKCPRCGVQVPQERKMDEEVPPPWCGDCCMIMERVWSAPPVHFKGSGFYKTDSGMK